MRGVERCYRGQLDLQHDVATHFGVRCALLHESAFPNVDGDSGARQIAEELAGSIRLHGHSPSPSIRLHEQIYVGVCDYPGIGVEYLAADRMAVALEG